VDIVEIFKALADETRIRMLNLLIKGELCVCDIEYILNIKQSNASRHLNKLKLAGLILAIKKSQWVYYRINEEIFLKYPFLLAFINDELGKISVFEQDLLHLMEHKDRGVSCK